MKYASIEEIKFAIQVLQLSASKVPQDSFAYTKLSAITRHVVFELEEMIKMEEMKRI